MMALLVALWLAQAGAGSPPRFSAPTRHTQDGFLKQRPVWSRDGKRLLFTRHKDDRIWLFELDPASGTERRLTQRDEPEYDGVWAADGSVLFTRVSFSGTQGDLDVCRIAADGALSVLAGTEGALSHEEWPALSPDGDRLAYTSTRSGNQESGVGGADGSGPAVLAAHAGLDAHPAWSPDGGRLAFASDRWGGLEIAVVDRDGGNLRRLTTSAGLDDYPAWSPDGSRVAFVSNRDGNFEIYVTAAEGGAAAFNVSQSPGNDSFPAWTPDGRGLTWAAERSGSVDLYSLEWESP
jgi:TolB protein